MVREIYPPSKELYLRTVRVTIKPPNDSGKKFEGFRFSFEIEKTNESTPNTSKIKIYNLSEKTRSFVERDKVRVIVEAGYQNTTAGIFVGNIIDNGVTHKKEKVDIITEIEAEDGGTPFRNATINRSFPPGTRKSEVYRALANTMGLPLNIEEGILPEDQYANGISFSGLARRELDMLCKNDALEWSIQDEAVQIIKENGTTLDSVVLLNPTTGLVGSPSKTSEGVEFTSLLQAKLRPGRRVKLESKFVNGTFKVVKARFIGDSHKDKFVTVCEAKA